MSSRSNTKNNSQWKQELDDLIRGMSGGFLFGIPLLYTMEVWWIGSAAAMPRLLLALLLTLAVVFLLNRTAGFRQTQDIAVSDALMDSVEAIALGLFCAGCMLVLLQEINPQTPLPEALGKLVYEGVPFSIGVALANQVLSGDRWGKDNESHQANAESSPQANDASVQTPADPLMNATLSDVGGTLIGAMIIAFNIAPTDEIPMLTAAMTGLNLLAVLAASLAISYAIVFVAGFANQRKRQEQQGLFQRPMSETLMAYLVSLGAALLMLLFFDKLHWDDPWPLWLSSAIVLGLPAAIGGAAGRLAV
jgi:putative integral membrane protein (TIGR02587 family)